MIINIVLIERSLAVARCTLSPADFEARPAEGMRNLSPPYKYFHKSSRRGFRARLSRRTECRSPHRRHIHPFPRQSMPIRRNFGPEVLL